MKRIFLDTETTGFVAEHGDRIIEVGAVAFDGRQKEAVFHAYFNPECDVSFGAQKVHGKSWGDLQDEPLFAERAMEVADFVRGAQLIMHNAEFDAGFLDAEFRRAGLSESLSDVAAEIVCSLTQARRWHPRLESHKLDSLACEFGIIDDGGRMHGALLDAELLAALYFHPKFNRGE